MVMAESSRFGFMELLVFVSALVAGTCCSLCSKVMMQMSSANMEKEYQKFSSPLFQTLVMFIGMMIGLVLHIAVVLFRVPFPGYSHSFHKNTERGTPFWVYFALFIPSAFDLGATAFCMAGLRYVNVSVYQMLRGGAVVFVACFKHFLLRKQLKTFMWIGVLLNVVAIGLTGSSAVLSAKENHSESVRSHISHEDINTSGDSGADSGSLKGVLLILVGAFLQGLQYVAEEWLMSAELGLSAVPPVLLIGMEGLWGTILCLGVAYPIVYALPGPDHGSFENLQNTLVMVANSSSIQLMVIVYTMSIFVYNLLGCLVTYMLSAVWHAILDNFRPVTIWMTDLCIFYVPIWLHMAPAKSQLLRAAGEQWLNWSFLQLLGMVVLFYGTAVYNAPNPGSIQLTGGLGSLFLDCSKEYEEIVATQSATSTSTDSDGASCSDSDDAVTHRAAVDSALSISLPSQRSLEILSYNGARRQQRQCYNDETTLLITRQEGRSSHVQDSLLPRTHP